MEMVIGKINKEVQDFATNIEQATSRLNSEFEQATSRFNTELEQASLLPQAFCEGSTSSPSSWPFSFKILLLILDSWIFDSSTTSCQVQWVVLGWFKLCCDVRCRVWWWDWNTMFLWKLDHAIITGVEGNTYYFLKRNIPGARGRYGNFVHFWTVVRVWFLTGYYESLLEIRVSPSFKWWGTMK